MKQYFKQVGSTLQIFLIVSCFSIGLCYPANITTIDFTQNAIVSNSILWANIVGISMNTNYMYQYMNSSLFQQYLLNSNIYGDWANNWALSLKTPKGFRYDCQGLQNATNVTIDCQFDSSLNTTSIFYDILGQYVWNTVNQPYWCISYDLQGIDLKNVEHADIFLKWLIKVFQYCDEIMDYGDKAVQMGIKTGSYKAADFISDISDALDVTWYIWHSGPGITQDADPSWMAAIEDFGKLSFGGHFTVRCIIFKNISEATIQNLLSDKYTKIYLANRFYVNQTYSWTNFNYYPLAISDIKLTDGMGIDGVTNSMAAALWALDFILQFSLYSPFQMDFNNDFQAGNFQTLFKSGPQFQPTSLFYGLLFASLMRNGSPKVIMPSQTIGISQNIKAWGLQTYDQYKFLLINKDTNASLNGNVYVKTYYTSPAICMYLSAPSLSETKNITIAGYSFLANNSQPVGTYKTYTILFDSATNSYPIPIKYAQAVLCWINNAGPTFPTGTRKFQSRTLAMSLLLIIIMILTH